MCDGINFVWKLDFVLIGCVYVDLFDIYEVECCLYVSVIMQMLLFFGQIVNEDDLCKVVECDVVFCFGVMLLMLLFLKFEYGIVYVEVDGMLLLMIGVLVL